TPAAAAVGAPHSGTGNATPGEAAEPKDESAAYSYPPPRAVHWNRERRCRFPLGCWICGYDAPGRAQPGKHRAGVVATGTDRPWRAYRSHPDRAWITTGPRR